MYIPDIFPVQSVPLPARFEHNQVGFPSCPAVVQYGICKYCLRQQSKESFYHDLHYLGSKIKKRTVVNKKKYSHDFRDVPDTTLPDTGFNQIVICQIPDIPDTR